MTMPCSPSGDAEALAEEAVEVAGTLVDLIEAADISDEVHLPQLLMCAVHGGEDNICH